MATDAETGLDVADIIAPGGPGNVSNRVNAVRAAAIQSTPPIVGNSVDVSSFLGQASTAYNANRSSLLSGMPGGGSGLATATTAATTLANAKGAIATIDNAASMQVKADDIAAALRFGTIPGAGSVNVVAISEAIKNEETRVMQMQDSFKQQLASYNQKANVNPLSDPLSWIINQITLPAEHGKLAGAAAELDAGISSVKQKFDVLHQMYQLTDEAHKQNLFTDQSASVERAAALRQVASAEAQFELSRAQFESARIGISAQSIRLAENKQQFDVAVSLQNAQNQSTSQALNFQHLSLEEESNARAAESQKVQLSIANMNSAQEAERIAARTDLQKRYDNVSIAFNQNRVMVDQMPFMSDEIKKFYSAESMNPFVQEKGTYGRDAAQSVMKLNTLPIALPAGPEDVRKELMKSEQTAMVNGPNGGLANWKNLPTEEQHILIQKQIETDMNKQMKLIPDSGSIFSPAPLLSTVKIPAVAATTIGQSLMPYANGEQKAPLKAQDIFASAPALIAEGKISEGQAVLELQQIYKAVMSDVNERNQTWRFGFDGLNQSTGYRVGVTTGGLYSSTTQVDMLNRADIERVLARMIKTPTNKDYLDQAKAGILGIAP